MIKALETSYNGYRCRSRLEARWLRFLDAMGAHYRYEIEGFDVAGTWYLPDIYLTKDDVWLEVKPVRPDDLTLYQNFAAKMQRPIAILCGQPGDSKAEGGEILLCLPDGSTCDALLSRNGIQYFACLPLSWDGSIGEANEAARSARFEHGEAG